MNAGQFIVPSEGGRNSDGFLEMVNRILPRALGPVHFAEASMRLTDDEFLAFPWEGVDRICDAAFSAASSCPSECNNLASVSQHTA